ncbi:MAG: hypothetical protein MI864_18665 [Pseudomonadales bacterium]|nr:hypothetical protein [Pseudomonadales bacterium]
MKQQVKALHLAGHDPRTPIARNASSLLLLPTRSPIDLIPDYQAVKLIPEPLFMASMPNTDRAAFITE